MPKEPSFGQRVNSIARNIIDHSPERADAIVDHLIPHVRGVESIIDIGAGGCRVAQRLIQRAGVEVVPYDVVQWNETDDLYLNIYDGEVLPVEDKSFDTSLIIFALHHATDQRRLLADAKRVTKNKIIVVEDSPSDELEHAGWEMLDKALNYGRHDDIAIAHGTRTAGGWGEVFSDSGLSIVHTEQYRSTAMTGGLYPHTQFVLKQIF